MRSATSVRSTTPDPDQVQALLPGLPPEAVDQLALTARQITFLPGETIMGESERWSPAVVAEGTVRLAIRSSEGREATLRQVGRGVFIGLVALFHPDYANPIPERSVIAVERSTLIFLDPAILSALCQRHASFTMFIVRGLVDWGSALSDAAGRYAFMSVRGRLASHLRGVAVHDQAWGLTAEITQQQLADAIGSVREVVARTLHEMRTEGLIEVSRARITLIDPERLTQIASDVT